MSKQNGPSKNLSAEFKAGMAAMFPLWFKGYDNKQLVYLLWEHDDSGPIRLVATLDKDTIIALAKKLNKNSWYESVGKPNLVDDLKILLREHGDDVGIYPLMDGWGGLHLQIVALDEEEKK